MTPRCRYLQGEWYEGKEIQIFCTHPDVIKTHICPFGDEVECDLNVHLKNLQNAESKQNE